ncbi:hypothetical protein LCGC14_2736220 [marine sediment metagenome]|uniref:Uncharacterized protein n=1 Tax=marine sediment metagenome TaxID=412755 RepID=A0A0F8Z5U5_9ZZZZ
MNRESVTGMRRDGGTVKVWAFKTKYGLPGESDVALAQQIFFADKFKGPIIDPEIDHFLSLEIVQYRKAYLFLIQRILKHPLKTASWLSDRYI